MESCEYLKFRVQAGGTANTLAGVLPTPRIVPSTSAVFQTHSAPGRGEATYVGSEGPQETWELSRNRAWWRQVRLGVHSTLSGRRSQGKGQRPMATAPDPPGQSIISAQGTGCQALNRWAGLQPGPRAEQLGSGSPTRKLMFAFLNRVS